MSSTFCTKCGTAIAPGSQFCPRCGAAVQVSGAVQPVSPPQATPPAPVFVPVPPPPKKSRTTLYVVIAVVVIVVVILAALAVAGVFSPASSSASKQVTVVTTGTVWPINAGYYEYVGPVDLTAYSSWTVSGTFTATNGIAAYVMTSDEFSAWGGSGSPSAYYWTSGTGVTSGSVDTVLPSGTYYFVWENTNIITATSVEITSDVVADAS